jgi:hypothetical protein
MDNLAVEELTEYIAGWRPKSPVAREVIAATGKKNA